MAEAVAEHSYGATTIAHVVSHAGVSRKTFYEHFRDKEHCFLAMYDTGIAFVLGRLAEVLDAAPDPRSRLIEGLREFLTVLADEPAFCRAIVLEIYAVGPTGVNKRRAVLQVFAGRYLEVNRQARELDPTSARWRATWPSAWWARSSSAWPAGWRRAARRSCPTSPTRSRTS